MGELGMMNNIHNFEIQNELIEQLSQRIIKNLEEAILKNGKATLLVSGGNTPKPLFEKLSSINIDWEKVVVGLCDERWVSTKHKDSNELFVKSILLKNFARKAQFVPLFQENLLIEDAQEFCSQTVANKLFPFDVVILGMGTDGHTASLFPNNVKLKEALSLDNENLCISMEPEFAPHKRMSLTRSAILGACNIYLHFEGEEKQKIFEKVLEGMDINKMPISSIINQSIKSIEVYTK